MVVLAWTWGCTTPDEQARIRRVWEMQDHEDSYLAGRDAILRGDLASAQQAGVELAQEDPVPGLPEAAIAHLAKVREGGALLSEAPTLEDAAHRLVAITSDCAACHRSMAVSVSALRDDPRDLLWAGLVFESDASWQSGVAKLPDPGALADAPGWPERRAAVAELLARGRP